MGLAERCGGTSPRRFVCLMTAVEADQLHRRFITAAEADEILRELSRFDDENEVGGLPAQTVLELRYSALHGLHRILGSDALSAREIILNRLLPMCLKDADTEQLERNIVFIECRELAGEWLNALTGPEAPATISAAIAFLITEVDGSTTCLPACWTIAEIGYRAPELTERLWQLFRSNNQEESDTALATLAALGLTGDDRSRCLAAAVEAARERMPYTIVGTLAALPDAATIPTLTEAWLDRPQAELEAVAESLFFLFSRIGARLQMPDAIDKACAAIAQLLARAPAFLGRRVRLAGNALPSLDSPLSTETLVRLLPEETTATAYDRWLVMLRLKACCRPRQLAGFEGNAAQDPALIAVLSDFVLEVGEFVGRDSTFEGQVKISALETALLLSSARSLDWLGPALANERNPYLQQEIMEAYAALRISPLPDPIPRWITEEAHLGDQAVDNIELMRRLAASRVARSAATSEAFDLLSRPGLIRENAVMQETAEGLIAATLFVGADFSHRPNVLEQLFTAVENPATLPQLSSGCHALAAAARQGWLADRTWADRLLIALTSEPNIPLRAHDRAQLIAAVEALPPTAKPGWLPERLAAWAHEADPLGARAIQALLEMNLFSRFTELLAPKLGLVQSDDNRWQWHLETPGQVEWAPLGVVLLYAQSPDSFAPALCAVLDDERWFVRHDAVGLLQALVVTDRASLLEPVRDALMARVRRRQSSRFADPPLIRQVAMLAPERFALQRWNELYQNWMEDARVALADALGALPLVMLLSSPELHRNVAAQLVQLSRDGQFAVRRSAQRSLGRVHAGTLESFCETLAAGSDAEERIFAAEASSWLPAVAISPSRETVKVSPVDAFWSPDIEGWSKRFEADVSKRVRNQARTATAARQRREWASGYFLRLSVISDPSNSELLATWKVGNALAQTGDDETLRRLRSHLETTSLTPSLRFRLTCVAKEMEKNWEAVTKKWPQPSLSLPGGIETFEARLRSRDREWVVHCTLWHVAGITADAQRRWGGIAAAGTTAEELNLVAAFGDRDALLLTKDSSTRVLVNSWSEDLISFRGVGDYPRTID